MKPFEIASMEGGLATRRPPTMITPSQSPDLTNVLVRDNTVRKRGGFTPLFRDRMPGNAIRNVAWRTVASQNNTGSAVDGDFVVSAGHMVAGHRSIYEDSPELVVALWMRPDKLIGQQGGNGQTALQIYYDAPYDILVHPIISKGSVKKSTTTHGVSAANQWGAHANSGLPFCLYLWNAGTGAAPVWELRLSAHVLVAGTWTLQTVTASTNVPIEEGSRYHVIFAVSGERVAIRLARYRDPIEHTYYETETTFSGTLAWNKCPIQVFDCPQLFVDATNVGTATQRPGLNLAGSTVGGWWFASQRPEMTLDDIAVWVGDRDLSELETRRKVIADGSVGLANHWSMDGPSLEYLEEDTGRGNHLFFVPRGPVALEDGGGRYGGCMMFNGVTSFAQLRTGARNWRSWGDPVKDGSFYTIVRDNMAHGMAVDVWVDAIEPLYEQVIAEIHAVMRLAIGVDGRLRAYVRNGGVTAAPATLIEIGAEYQSGTGNLVLQPGHRYHIALLRRDGGAAVDIYIDGKLDAAITGLNPSSYQTVATDGNSYGPGGITLGMGSYERMIRGASPLATAAPNTINTDSRTGFVGRIETFRILCGSDAAVLIKKNGPEDIDDWTYPESRVWRNPISGVDAAIAPANVNDTVRLAGRGTAMQVASQQEGGLRVAHAVDGSTVTGYTLSQDTQAPDLVNGLGGHLLTGGMGARLLFVFAYFSFESNPKRDRATGAYRQGYESRYNGGTATTNTSQANETKTTHIQQCAIADQVGNLSDVLLMCSEADWMDEADAQIFPESRAHTFRQRPYTVRSPFELGPQWTISLADQPVGTLPVTMVADYDVQTEYRRLSVAACGKSLFWAKPQWDNGSLLFVGGFGSYVEAQTDPAQPPMLTSTGGVLNPLQVSAWLNPTNLDGVRVIAGKRTLGVGSENLPNFIIYAQDGALVIMGANGLGDPWRFVQGAANAAGTDWIADSALRIDDWNHVCVQLGTTDVKVWINGQAIDMLDTSALIGSNQTAAYLANIPVEPVGPLYIGGFPEDWHNVVVGLGLGSPELTFESVGWHGYIRNVQCWSSLDTARYTATGGYVPMMDESDTSALYSWPMDEGEGYFVRNVATATAAFNADSRIKEFIPIKDGLRQEAGRRWSTVNYRDSIIVTNGADYPHKITFNGLLTSKPWRVERVGMEAPQWMAARFTGTEVAGPPDPITAGEYLIYATFINDLGLESEVFEVGIYDLTTDVGALAIQVRGLPRSHDPQVVGRRLYVSPAGGGSPVFNIDIPDNESWDVTVEVYQATGAGPDPGERQPAPRARHCAIVGSSLCLADLPDLEAGQVAFAFSALDEISYFPVSTEAVLIDGEDGKPIIGISQLLGDAYFSKRDSVYKLSVGAVVTATQVDASLRVVQPGDSIGGGGDSGDNMLYGAGDRGVFRFGGTDLVYISDEIERTWRNEIDRSNLGLYAMFGAYWRSYSQYWLSVRRVGQELNDVILAFDVAAAAWARLDVPAHSWMGMIESVTGEPLVTIGRADGRIYAYRDEVWSDLSDAEPNGKGAVTRKAASGITGSSTTLVVAGANFQSILAGLVGATVTVTYLDGGGATVVAERVIESNDEEQLVWTQPLAGWASHVSFVVGAIASYWTSMWWRNSPIAQDQRLVDLHLEFEPEPGDLVVDIASVRIDEKPDRAFPSTYERFDVPMGTGSTERNLLPRAQRGGLYHRFRAGTYGIDDPFSLIRFAPKMSDTSTSHRAGRTS